MNENDNDITTTITTKKDCRLKQNSISIYLITRKTEKEKKKC